VTRDGTGRVDRISGSRGSGRAGLCPGVASGGVEIAVPRPRLDVVMMRKLGRTDRAESSMRAIAGGGVVVLNDGVVGGLSNGPQDLRKAAERGCAGTAAPGAGLPGGIGHLRTLKAGR
jgi:hypothetical protein